MMDVVDKPQHITDNPYRDLVSAELKPSDACINIVPAGECCINIEPLDEILSWCGGIEN